MGEVGGVGQVFALGNYVPGNRTSRLATLLDPDFTHPEFHVLENLTYFPCQNLKTSKQFGQQIVFCYPSIRANFYKKKFGNQISFRSNKVVTLNFGKFKKS